MSESSFPRAEHVRLLREKIAERVREKGLAVEIAERGLNHYKCQYRFALRRPPERDSPEQDWIELPIHFQVAERLESTHTDAELSRILDAFLQRHFG
jgi:hypothetical protein